MPTFTYNRYIVSFTNEFKQFCTTQHLDVSRKKIVFIGTRIGDILYVRELSKKKPDV